MRALVTGCSSGIGRATAIELAGRGHEVIASARRVESIDTLPVAQAVALDVDHDESVEAAVDAIGAVDALVNNAAVRTRGPVERVSVEVTRRMFETNVLGPLRLIQAFVPGMRHRGHGVVVNVSSVAGRVGPPLDGAYAATKHALEALSEALAVEVGRFGVRVAIVEPGFVEPGMRHHEPQGDAAPYDELLRRLPRLTGGGTADPPLTADAVARLVADVVEGDDDRLRWPVGADAVRILAARERLDDEAFRAELRVLLDLDW